MVIFLKSYFCFHKSHYRYIIGLAGPPGAGKSTLAIEVVRKLNMVMSEKESRKKNSYNSDDFAIVVPMDGFHLYRSQLDAMEVRTYINLKLR